jgi:hypothetical protein
MDKIQVNVSEISGQYFVNKLVDTINTIIDESILIDGGVPVEIGDINYSDLNSATAGVTTVDVVFSNAKPAGKYIFQLIYKNTEAFASYTYGYTENSVSSVAQIANTVPVDISALNATIPNGLLDDITIRVTLGSENLQDWTAGNIKIYALFAVLPTV